MAMTAGSAKDGAAFGINVTPLIDVLLVLLIIFMVIVPMTPKGFDTQVPQPSRDKAPAGDAIVLTVTGVNSAAMVYRINQLNVAKNDLLAKLSAIYANRADRTLFIRSEGEVEYQQVAEVIDASRVAGVDRVAFLTPKLQAGM
ncbi:MAG TPA: biopolymer transporter ExbD [Acidobacteriaceae bacterium]